MSREWIPQGATPYGYIVNLHPASAADLLKGSDDVEPWIRLDLLTRRIVGRRLEQALGVAVGELLE